MKGKTWGKSGYGGDQSSLCWRENLYIVEEKHPNRIDFPIPAELFLRDTSNLFHSVTTCGTSMACFISIQCHPFGLVFQIFPNSPLTEKSNFSNKEPDSSIAKRRWSQIISLCAGELWRRNVCWPFIEQVWKHSNWTNYKRSTYRDHENSVSCPV